ncbi:hypothetical protein PVAP13_2NG240500 [Panicum virgatum]|uniref:Poly(A) RNA polymerase mitochondrial-like central palm domain-containing protein n=1 Tax=Panicum virgatum TaxID=38727 RepID=A0A8T0VM82_PANVG|nr:hypothetical protein PVAP13_2NG240500 [Panicum virgatum]
MAAPACSTSVSDDSDSSQCSEASIWDSQELRRQAECLELKELAAISVNTTLLPTLNHLLLEVYAVLRPKPLDYDQRNTLVDVFRKITKQIFGSNDGFPVVEPFGSFTMDLFTPRGDLDLSVNFNANTDDRYTRKEKISVIRKFSKVLYSHQRNGICCGVLPIVSARVPILKVIDCGTGIECDISVENKDGMTRSMIFKYVSMIDERFQILSYLVKFWANIHDLNSPRKLTMSSMSIISLVAFHLQTRHPPILPAFSALLKDGLDCASVERNILPFKGFGSRNTESVAELFVSLISKLLSAESLWEHGLCASNFEASWISKTWKKGVGNLSVEDFLDRSQNFARSVGKVQMQKICRCLRQCALNLLDFMRGKLDTPKLKTLLFGRLSPDEVVSKPRLKHGKRKRKSELCQQGRYAFQKRAKRGGNATTSSDSLPAPASNKVFPLVHDRGTGIHRFVPIIPWPRIIPSGFGYGLSLEFPSGARPHPGKGILGRWPSNAVPLNQWNSTSAAVARST